VALGSALAIYVTAGPTPGDPLAREDSRQYRRTMELYGGKASILAAELLDWLQSLWHGRRLAGTVACATVLAAAVVWLVDVVLQE
jgi:phytoene/squalene synthetase